MRTTRRTLPTTPGIDPANENVTLAVLQGRLTREALGTDPAIHAAAEAILGALQVAEPRALALVLTHLTRDGARLLDALGRCDMAARGLDKSGHWVGFDRAAATWTAAQ